MRIMWCCLAILFLASCGDAVFTPKPRGYFRVNLPEHKYRSFQKDDFPYSFDYPIYAELEREKYFFDDEAPSPYWLNVVIPELGGKIYLSYNAINGKADLEKLLNDAHFLSYFHTKKADYIEDARFATPNNVHGLFFEVGGDAASAYQFIATDSTHHFLRGALYIDAVPNADSLLPVNDFLKKDVEHLIKTLRWRTK